jgi:hypothetical protein
MEAKERQLVPVAALKGNLALAYMEDSAASQAHRIAPFEDRHVAVLKYVLRDANHLGGRKLSGKHRLDGSAAFNRILCDLM